MRQDVTVISVSGNTAEVACDRPAACHGDCGQCAGGCTAVKEHIVVRAENRIGAAPGDRVTIESRTRAVYSAEFFVYVLPLALFFALYFLFDALLSRGTLPGILGFFLGLGIAVFVSRRKRRKGRETEFQIIGYAHCP